MVTKALRNPQQHWQRRAEELRKLANEMQDDSRDQIGITEARG